MIAIAKRIVADNGGTSELGNKLCESIAKRRGFVKRKATTAKPIIAPGLISEAGHTHFTTVLMESSKLMNSHLK